MWGHETCEGCAEVVDVRRAEARRGMREEGEEEERRRWDAGRCLFKTRTQHHRMVGKKVMHPKSGDAWEFRAWTATIARPTSLPLSGRDDDDDDDLGGFRCN